MKSSMKRLSGAILAAVILVGCQVQGGDPAFPGQQVQRVAAGTNPDQAVLQGRLGAEPRVFAVTVAPAQTSVGGEPAALYLEVSGGNALEIEVFTSSGAPLAWSASPTFFQAGVPQAAAASTTFKPLDITTQFACRGPCVIRTAVAGTTYVRIRNDGAPTDVNLYAYTRAFQDFNHPQNNQRQTAPSIAASGFVTGAIETIGDQDFYRVAADGSLAFDGVSGSPLDLVAEIIDPSSGTVLEELAPGGPTMGVAAGDYIRVRSLDDRAGPASTSWYSLIHVP